MVLHSDEHVGGPQPAILAPARHSAIVGAWLGLQGDDVTGKPWHRASSREIERGRALKLKAHNRETVQEEHHNSWRGHWKWHCLLVFVAGLFRVHLACRLYDL